MSSIDFDELIGGEFDFYGVDGNCFKLDDTVYEAVESNTAGIGGLEEIRVCQDSHRLHELPVARVVIEHAAFGDEIYELIDLHDGHRWLQFGTEYHDTSERSFDALFLFDYTPKAPQEQ